MTESFPNQIPESEKERQKNEYIALAEILAQKHEGFPFPGIDPEWYARLKATDEEYPGITTPTDEIVSRMKREGIKVVFGGDPKSGNVFLLPRSSDNIGEDMLFPKHLKTESSMDPLLKALIIMDKNASLKSNSSTN